MKRQELEGRSCLKQHPDHLRRPNLGQQSRRLHGKAAANSRKVIAAVKKVKEEEEEVVVVVVVMEEAAAVVVVAAAVKEAVKEAACSWKELDLKDEMTSLEWPTAAQKDWAHGIRIQPKMKCRR
jgi:hypothetical protein